MRVFSTGELSEFVTITAAMRVEKVEDIYRRAWDLLSLPASASQGQAPAQAIPATVAGPSEFPHEQMDVMALARYKVMPSHASMLHRHAVVAGDGSQQLYIGREVECENMARKFAGAFLDGAFAFHSMLAAAPTTQPAPQQEAQEPVAWYVTGCCRLLDEDEAKAEARHIGGTARAIPLYTVPQADSVLEDAARLEFEMQHDSAIAAARKQGANHG